MSNSLFLGTWLSHSCWWISEVSQRLVFLSLTKSPFFRSEQINAHHPGATKREIIQKNFYEEVMVRNFPSEEEREDLEFFLDGLWNVASPSISSWDRSEHPTWLHVLAIMGHPFDAAVSFS